MRHLQDVKLVEIIKDMIRCTSINLGIKIQYGIVPNDQLTLTFPSTCIQTIMQCV